jgi:hypothetical protein
MAKKLAKKTSALSLCPSLGLEKGREEKLEPYNG